MEVNAEVLIIGGGLAGSAAAISLASRGRDVTLVEKETAPHHKVCGEFLSFESLHYLGSLGIQVEKLGATVIDAVRLTGPKNPIEVSLPFPAMSLTRRCLDEALLQRATACGAKVLRGKPVEALSREQDCWRANLADDVSVAGKSVFLASGKHDLRAHARPSANQSGMIAFKSYWRLAPMQMREISRCVELVLYRGGYAGLQLVEDGVVNLCCLIEAKEFQRVGARWLHLLEAMKLQSSHLSRRLQGAEPVLERPLAISSIPYGFVRKQTEGLWYLGDQAAVIPSFTGDGMALALHTGRLAAQMYVNGDTAAQYQQRVASQVKAQVRFAMHVSRLLVSLPRFSLFGAQCWPGAIKAIAKQTRIPPEHLLHSAS